MSILPPTFNEFSSKQGSHPLGESMMFYTKKVDEKISNSKRNIFLRKHKKVDSIFIKFHFETMVLSIGFVLS